MQLAPWKKIQAGGDTETFTIAHLGHPVSKSYLQPCLRGPIFSLPSDIFASPQLCNKCRITGQALTKWERKI